MDEQSACRQQTLLRDQRDSASGRIEVNYLRSASVKLRSVGGVSVYVGKNSVAVLISYLSVVRPRYGRWRFRSKLDDTSQVDSGSLVDK